MMMGVAMGRRAGDASGLSTCIGKCERLLDGERQERLDDGRGAVCMPRLDDVSLADHEVNDAPDLCELELFGRG